MRLQLRKMDKNTWIDDIGNRIKVWEMDAIYLENTLKWLRENKEEIMLSILATMDAYIQNAPDGAADCCRAEMNAVLEMSTDEFLILAVEPYKKMLERYEQELEKLK